MPRLPAFWAGEQQETGEVGDWLIWRMGGLSVA